MERDGLIRRVPDLADGRQSRIQLTRRGRALEDTLISAARDTNSVALDGLTSADSAQLMKLVKRMIANLEHDSDTH
jgi:DNA-binding MarR family transcriptional regulator